MKFSDKLEWLEAAGAKIDQKVQNTPKIYVLEPNLATSSGVTVYTLDLFNTGHCDMWLSN